MSHFLFKDILLKLPLFKTFLNTVNMLTFAPGYTQDYYSNIDTKYASHKYTFAFD